MTTIFERNAKGEVAFGNGAKIKIPTDRSMLSFAYNDTFNGDDFRDDGYVYNKKKARRRWFSGTVYGLKRVWEPNLKVSRLERYLDKYLLCSAKVAKLYKGDYAALKKRVKNGKKDKYGEHVVYGDRFSYSISKDGISQGTKKGKPSDLGRRFERIWDRTHVLHTRMRILRSVIITILNRALPSPHDYGAPIKFRIGKHEVFASVYAYKHALEWNYHFDVKEVGLPCRET